MSLTARGVSIHFGGLVAVDAMDLDAIPPEIIGLIGPNGAGKTTFLNCLSGIYRPTAGSVLWNGEELIGQAPHVLLARGIARTFQNITSLHSLSVLDVVKLGSNMRGDIGLADRLRNLFRSEKALDEELTEMFLKPLRLADVAHYPIQRPRMMSIRRRCSAYTSVETRSTPHGLDSSVQTLRDAGESDDGMCDNVPVLSAATSVV